MAGKYKIRAKQGATLRRRFSPSTDGEAWVFTGYAARMQVRTSVDSDDVVLEATTEDGGFSFPTVNQIDLFISAEALAGVAAGPYVYDIELVAPGGDVVDFLEGAFVVKAEVTR